MKHPLLPIHQLSTIHQLWGPIYQPFHKLIHQVIHQTINQLINQIHQIHQIISFTQIAMFVHWPMFSRGTRLVRQLEE